MLERLIEPAIDPADINKVAESATGDPGDSIGDPVVAFHALSDPLRWAIVGQLRTGELCVCDLINRLAIGQSKLSFHLKVLKQARLVSSRQEGRWVYYALNQRRFEELHQVLAAIDRSISQSLNPAINSGRPLGRSTCLD